VNQLPPLGSGAVVGGPLESSIDLGGVVPTAVAVSAAAPLITPAPVNNAAEPTINVSGLELNSVLALGNLVQQTIEPQ